MFPEDAVEPVQAYFLLDITKPSAKYTVILRELTKRYEGVSHNQHRIEPRELIHLPLNAIPVSEHPASEQCDLGYGFKRVLESLPTEQSQQAEVFVLLQNMPGGNWEAPLSELAKRNGIGIHVFQLPGNELQISMDDTQLMEHYGVDLQEAMELGKIVDAISHILENRIDLAKLGSLPQKPRSLQIVLHPEVSQVEKSKTKSQPPAAEPDGQKTEILKLELETKTDTELSSPVPQPEEAKNTPLPQATEVAPAKIETEPQAQQPAQPTAQDDESLNKPESEIELVKKQAKPEPEPPVGKDGVAAIWKNLEPPEDATDRYPHAIKQRLEAGESWVLVAASRRGKMHAHQGIFREDAFGLAHAEGWNFVVVADGGGSRPLARVGANLAASEAIEAMCREARNLAKSETSVENACRYILENAIHQAYDAIRKEALRRERKIDDFGTTFLAVAHRPAENQHILGALQVGDGLIAAMFADRQPQVLADPDVGETASQTLFMTGKPWNEWIGRIKVYGLDIEPAMLACMCDGVSDDLIPYKTNLPQLFAHLSEKVKKESPEDELLDFLSYDKRGSFDDRTLALIYLKPAGKPTSSSTAGETVKPPTDKVPPKAESDTVQASSK